MSSHHIVRDEQEPALIIGDAYALPWEELGQLLEWSPTVICSHRALEGLQHLGIKVDVVVVTEAEFADLLPLLEWHYPVQVLRVEVPALSVRAFVAKGLHYLQAKGYGAANLVVPEGVTFLLEGLPGAALGMDVVVFNGQYRAVRVKGGVFEKWYAANQRLGVACAGAGACFTSRNLVPALQGQGGGPAEQLRVPAGGGLVQLQCSASVFWVLEYGAGAAS